MNSMSEKASIPRPEHPRPQMVRTHWLNLNGPWEFELDLGLSGKEKNFHLGKPFTKRITVPFCPESELSGIGEKDFMPCVWYRRNFQTPEEWQGKRVLLHFGAVDYETSVWVNGELAETHRGGYSSFSFEITQLLKKGENTIQEVNGLYTYDRRPKFDPELIKKINSQRAVIESA